MFILLIAGIACLALAGLQLTRPRLAADRDRRAALDTVRGETPAGNAARRSLFVGRITAILAQVHRMVWPKETADDVTVKLLRAGASRRLTAEIYMAGRVGVTTLGIVAGLTFAHGAGRILLAIAIEAGMSFDAALNYLVEATDGALVEEMRRVLTELRVGESRRAAIRSFALRVGTDDAMAFANAVLASDQLGSPLAGILKSQAADLRHRRQLHAEERAQKTPVKMLFPMVIFILPVMFAIILGPAFLGDHSVL